MKQEAKGQLQFRMRDRVKMDGYEKSKHRETDEHAMINEERESSSAVLTCRPVVWKVGCKLPNSASMIYQ